MSCHGLEEKKSKPPVSCRVMSSWVEEKEGQEEKTSGLTARRVLGPLVSHGGRGCGHMSCRVVSCRVAVMSLRRPGRHRRCRAGSAVVPVPSSSGWRVVSPSARWLLWLRCLATSAVAAAVVVGPAAIVVTVVACASGRRVRRCYPLYLLLPGVAQVGDVARRCDDPVVGELAQVAVVHHQRVP